MIYVRVSTLDLFRRCIQESWASADSDLVERIIRGQWTAGPSTWQQDAGTALHYLLANPGKFPDGQYRHKGLSFITQEVDALLRVIGPGTREVTESRALFPGVCVEGTADVVRGLTIQDHKTCFGAPDAQDYERSLQWRLYLLLHEAQVFQYNLIEATAVHPTIRLHSVCRPTFWAYSRMFDDCQDWAYRFSQWATKAGLLPHLERRR